MSAILIPVSIVVVVVVVAVVLAVTLLRVRGQRVTLRNGRLVTASGFGASRSIDVADIGTVLYIPEDDEFRVYRYKMGVFDYGGLIILNRAGRVVRVIQHYAGSRLALRPIFDQIDAPEKLSFAGKRRGDLLRGYPNSIGFFRLRGLLFWGVTTAIMILLPILLAVVVAFSIFVAAQ